MNWIKRIFNWNKKENSFFPEDTPFLTDEYQRGGIEITLSEQLLEEQLREQQLKNYEQKLKNKVLEEQERQLRLTSRDVIEVKVIEEEIINTHPYISISLFRDIITINFNDGSTLKLPNISIEIFNKIKECTTEDEILNILSL